MKKIILYLALFLVGLLGAILAFGPIAVEKKLNGVGSSGPYAVSEKAASLHKTLLIADLHADSLMSRRDLLKRGTRGHVDAPRLVEGNVAVQSFTVVTKACAKDNPNSNPGDCDDIKYIAMAYLWPKKTWNSLLERALYQAGKLQGFSDKSNGGLAMLRSSADLIEYLEKRKTNPKITAGFLGLEGAHALEGNPANVDVLFNAGYRMIGPTHFFDNEMAGSQHGAKKYGLTADGRKMIESMRKKGMIVDLAHSSQKTIDDILTMKDRPAVLVSHTGVRGTCDNNRNLSDEYLKKIAAAGGVIGIGYWKTATCGNSVKQIVRAMKHAVKVAGADHVALGSDYDGTIVPPFDASGVAMITDEMLKQGFSEPDIRKIMGENTINFLVKNLPPR